MIWHVQPDSLARYLGGHAEPAEAMSIEAHVVNCGACRIDIAARSDGERLARTWASVVDEIDRPYTSVLERVLTRLGLSNGRARLLASAPSMHMPWVLATTAVIAFALVAASVSDSTKTLAAMLVIAPVVPVLGVALSYGRGVDAIHELSMSTPIDKFQLLLVRAAAVLGLASVLSVGEALLVREADWTITTWLLPATALTAFVIALSTWLSTRTAAFITCAVWVLAVVTGLRIAGRGLRLDQTVLERLVLFRPAGQLALALIAATALFIAFERRDQFDMNSTI